MIAVLIGIIVIIGLLAVMIVALGIGIFFGIFIAVEDLMDDPYLRVAALRSLGDDDAWYRSRYRLHGIVKDQVNDKL